MPKMQRFKIGVPGPAGQLDETVLENAVRPMVVDQLALDPTPANAAATAVSTEIANRNLVEVGDQVVIGKNLHDPNADTVGVYVSEVTGVEVAFASYRTSDYIPVTAGQPYTVTQARKLVLYDTAKTYVSGQNLNQTAGPQTVTPAVNGFARFSNDTAIAAYTPNIQFEAGATATAFEPYSLAMPLLTLTQAQQAAASSGPVGVTKSGESFSVTTTLGTAGTLVIATTRNGSSNGTFTFGNTTLNGTTIHAATDDITPVRTFNTVGANHGYTCVHRYTMAGHGKTAADLGSIYTDGTRQYTLLRIDGNDLTFGGPYTETNGFVTGDSTLPAATLTHVSGGTNTGTVSITTRIAGAQLYPSVNAISVRYLLDGTEVTADGTYKGNVLQAVESYTILDYKALIDWARANIGQSFAANTSQIAGVVRIANTFTFRSEGRCTVSSSLTALKKVTMSVSGFIQSVALSRSGYTTWRYMPGVLPKGGVDFSVPVDMTGYATTLVFGPADYIDTTRPPSRYVDWLQSGATKLVGFAMGYITDKTNSRNSDRASLASGWDMRNTKKSYPIALGNGNLNPGDVRNIEGFRNYLAPHASGATIVTTVPDAQATYVHLDFHQSVTAQAVPLPEHIGKSVTVLQSTGMTVANDTVDAGGVTVTVPGTAGRAVLKLT